MQQVTFGLSVMKKKIAVAVFHHCNMLPLEVAGPPSLVEFIGWLGLGETSVIIFMALL